MNKISLVLLCIVFGGCKSWDVSLIPAKLMGPTQEQGWKVEEQAPLNPGSCPTPEEVEKMEKEFFKLKLLAEAQEKFWI